jgi:restriction system protein
VVPDFQSITLPFLKAVADGKDHAAQELAASLAVHFNLSQDDLLELLPSGRQTRFANRVHWAATYLYKCGLLERPKRGVVRITERGHEVLADDPTRLDLRYLARFPELAAFRSAEVESSEAVGEAVATAVATPDERLREAHREIVATLKAELLGRVLEQTPTFFEWLVVELLVAMGFGGAHGRKAHLGRSGDDGVDGVVDQDALGLDRVYVQAKRWRPGASVGAGEVRNFFGSLDAHKASKGVFITTSSFTRDAIDTAERLTKRIVLIDGNALAELMIRFGVGVRVEEKFEVQKIDEDFFLD